ncbi:helix-turn-helix transcriptional regulator [Flavobacterium sp. 5]|uniref:AraC family transcriptional regulator n=1 Tax=Flavobacterium sp. 5 TaxID=2035199 RepID=UPI000C2B9691|nr:helix-turn-helix transcriptional regulator [Flavobacterium sp. 5]PKB15761.1 AraC-like DNA-binding protein [Flavobacterium sp. 5]
MKTDIIKYDFKTGLPQEFEIVDLATLYQEFKNTLTTTHRTGFYHIIWFQQGNPTHLADFNPIKISPNSLLFLNKDTVHRFDKETKFEGKILLFTESFFCKTKTDTKFLRNTPLFNELFSITPIQIQKQSEVFANLMQSMADELQKTKDHFQADILQNLLKNFLLHSEREYEQQNLFEVKKGADFDIVILFKDLLEANFKNQKQVNFYAKALIITEKRLNQATSKVIGKTPKEIIDDRIILEIKRILVHTTGSIKEIGYSLGFEEPTNFIKYFKKHSQMTPVEFREKNSLA